MSASNVGKWDPWYCTAAQQEGYGTLAIYDRAEEWLAHRSVEDWGCGYAWFGLVHRGPYRGIDGTDSDWCNEVVDLTEYRSSGYDILLRGVLEHNREWRAVLESAVASFDQRLLILLFTPLQETTQVLAENVGGLGVPDIGFRLGDIVALLDGCSWWVEAWPAPDSGYDGIEIAIKTERVPM